MSERDSGAAHLHRLVLFSDAVFAIAITLLAIEIHPPHDWNGVADLFRQMAAKLVAYVVSFAVVGIYWISHRRIFERLKSANGVLDVLNFVVLGLVALLPLATELLWEQKAGQAFPVYVALVAAIGLAIGLLWAYAVFIGGLAHPTPRGEAIFVMLRVALLPGFMCWMSFFSLAYPWGWAVMAVVIVALRIVNQALARASAKAA
ncbi:TMEM175 family protein [uncultured Caulobacter sp.]|jgi:uncharacterized membrane protein|uniref:TMEM175 family protein n=1 Tax=uncultured Caulobacter sp. TaxID=158749 RepID=UPI0026194E0D|nr:TMEM175 family protein [uncultured Caulobacter sp.]